MSGDWKRRKHYRSRKRSRLMKIVMMFGSGKHGIVD
jgi:hypothetical protein